MTLIFKFIKAINKEYKVNLSIYLIKYKDIIKDEIINILRDEDDFSFFDALYKATSIN